MDDDPDTVYRHWTKRLVYTAGVRHIAEQAGAYWLVDAIASHQTNPKAKAEEFQVWTLTVRPDHSATLVMTDGNTKKPIIQQVIEYTDFGEPECELYLVCTPGQPAVLMQPCEY